MQMRTQWIRWMTCLTAALGVACGGESETDAPSQHRPAADMEVRDAGEDLDALPDMAMPAEMSAPDMPEEAVDCTDGVRRPQGDEVFESLSAYCFFEEPLAQHTPREGVVPYEVNASLYADHAEKFRFIVLPGDAQITFHPTERWEWPEGTIIIKTFYFDEGDPASPTRRVLETRLLTRTGDTWEPQTYLWDADQRDARRHLIGKRIEVHPAGMDEGFTYQVPNKNQCKNCHGQDNVLRLIGPRTRQLNGVSEITGTSQNQLERLRTAGMFANPPQELDGLEALVDYTDTTHPLKDRALAYLEGNCGHCHNPKGSGGTSGLRLEAHSTDPIDYGVCRRPVAAGAGAGELAYDIKPGAPEESILLYRMKSLDPEIKMPELPLRTVDPFAIDLITRWIAEMEGTCESP